MASSSSSTTASRTAKPKTPPFLEKLINILQKTDPTIIGWDNDGETFTIFDPARFSTEILGLYFNTKNMSSFVRQLNYHGFSKYSQNRKRGANGRKVWRFSHPQFRRGVSLETVRGIRRKTYDPNAATKGEVNQLRSQVSDLKSQMKKLEQKLTKMSAELAATRIEQKQAAAAAAAASSSSDGSSRKRKRVRLQGVSLADDWDSLSLYSHGGDDQSEEGHMASLTDFLSDMEFGTGGSDGTGNDDTRGVFSDFMKSEKAATTTTSTMAAGTPTKMDTSSTSALFSPFSKAAENKDSSPSLSATMAVDSKPPTTVVKMEPQPKPQQLSQKDVEAMMPQLLSAYLPQIQMMLLSALSVGTSTATPPVAGTTGMLPVATAMPLTSMA